MNIIINKHYYLFILLFFIFSPLNAAFHKNGDWRREKKTWKTQPIKNLNKKYDHLTYHKKALKNIAFLKIMNTQRHETITHQKKLLEKLIAKKQLSEKTSAQHVTLICEKESIEKYLNQTKIDLHKEKLQRLSIKAATNLIFLLEQPNSIIL